MAGLFDPGGTRTVIEISLCLVSPIVKVVSTSQPTFGFLPVHWVIQRVGRIFLFVEFLILGACALPESGTEDLVDGSGYGG